MHLEHVCDKDIPDISSIWRRHHSHAFPLPHRTNLITEAKAVIDGRIIGYGQVRPIAEPILVLDLDARLRDRVEALHLLMVEAHRGVRSVGLDRMFAFIRDPIFADLIEKRYGFDRSDIGEMLIKELHYGRR
jgi:hypothetical protein